MVCANRFPSFGNVLTLSALRFAIGFVEAASWPCLHFMIGTWFRNHEINKRAGILTAAGIAATMFSGYIQSGIYSHMDGHLGIRGWRWLFIVGKNNTYMDAQDKD